MGHPVYIYDITFVD